MIVLALVSLAAFHVSWLALGFTILLGAWLALDETALAQTWFSQPLPAGILAGLIWGEPGVGLALGLTLQLLAVGNLPVGQTFAGEKVTPLLGLVGAACASGWQMDSPFAGHSLDTGPLGWLLVAAALGSVAGDTIIRWERRLHHRFMMSGLRSMRDGHVEHMERAHGRSLWLTALRGAVMTAAWWFLAMIFWLPAYDVLPGRFVEGLALLPWLTPAVAIGSLIELYGSRQGLRWLGAGFLASLATAWALAGGIGS